MIPCIDTDTLPLRKERTITLYIEAMAQEVDAHTSKFTDANAEGNVKQLDAIASDSEESLDGTVIARLMEYRDAKLRVKLGDFLSYKEILEADNSICNNGMYIYELSLPHCWKDAGLKALAMIMHKYIVWGTLYDWYVQVGSAEANAYGRQLEDIESDLDSAISSPGYATVPLQPWGPAYL